MRFEGRWSIGEDKEGVKNLWSIYKPTIIDRFCARDVGVRYFGDRYAIKLTKEAAEAIKLMHGNHLWKNVFYDALNNRWLINVTFVSGDCDCVDYKALAHSTDTVDCELRLYSDGKVTCEVTDVFKDLNGSNKLKESQDTGRRGTYLLSNVDILVCRGRTRDICIHLRKEQADAIIRKNHPVRRALENNPTGDSYHIWATQVGPIGSSLKNGFYNEYGDLTVDIFPDGKVCCCIQKENRKFVDYSACSKLNKEDKKMRNRAMWTDFRIKNVIFNPPATIVMWGDGTKTVVKCQEGDIFDPEKGIAMCVMKRLYGTNPSGSNYLKVPNRYVKGFKKTSSDAVAVTDISEKALKVRDAMMTGGATKWELETFDRFCRKYLDRK